MADTPGLNYIRLDHNPLPLVVISCALSDKGIYERFVGNEQRASTMSRLRNGTRRARSPTSVTGIPRRRIFLPSSRTSAQIRVMAVQVPCCFLQYSISLARSRSLGMSVWIHTRSSPVRSVRVAPHLPASRRRLESTNLWSLAAGIWSGIWSGIWWSPTQLRSELYPPRP